MSTCQVEPTVYVLSLVTANTEYSQALPDNTRVFTVQLREAHDTRLAFATGKVAGSTDPFLTLKSGQAFNSPEKLASSGQTIYAACGTANVHLEILVWN